MFPVYTAVDLIRTMNQELVERHQQPVVRVEWEGAVRDRPSVTSRRFIIRRGQR